MTTCTIESHEAIKQDQAAWERLTFVKHWHLEADGDEPAEVLELRNCSCGSTLAKRIA